jgi:hypothetical protein
MVGACAAPLTPTPGPAPAGPPVLVLVGPWISRHQRTVPVPGRACAVDRRLAPTWTRSATRAGAAPRALHQGVVPGRVGGQEQGDHSELAAGPAHRRHTALPVAADCTLQLSYGGRVMARGRGGAAVRGGGPAAGADRARGVQQGTGEVARYEGAQVGGRRDEGANAWIVAGPRRAHGVLVRRPR